MKLNKFARGNSSPGRLDVPPPYHSAETPTFHLLPSSRKADNVMQSTGTPSQLFSTPCNYHAAFPVRFSPSFWLLRNLKIGGGELNPNRKRRRERKLECIVTYGSSSLPVEFKSSLKSNVCAGTSRSGGSGPLQPTCSYTACIDPTSGAGQYSRPKALRVKRLTSTQARYRAKMDRSWTSSSA